MNVNDLVLRPMDSGDLHIVNELGLRDASGFNWSGFRSEASLRKCFEEGGYIGHEDGWLVVSVDDGPCLTSVGWKAVNWSRPPYSRAWNIGPRSIRASCGSRP
jgi:hypothetical protein